MKASQRAFIASRKGMNLAARGARINITVSVKNEVLEMIAKVAERIAKMKYDREHKESLEKYPEMRERLQSLWELAYAEVISYNRKNLKREFQNESRQQNRHQTVCETVGRSDRRKEEI